MSILFESALTARNGLESLELSRRQLMLLALQLAVCASFPGCRKSAPVFGTSSAGSPLIVEDHSRALAVWVGRGITDAVLVNFDAHDDFRWIPDDKISRLGEIYSARDWSRFQAVDNQGDQSLYHLGNWIYAGARLGVFKEIYWVIPHSFFAREDPEKLLRNFLLNIRFSAEDVQTFSMQDQRFKGTFRGMPVTICGIERLPQINRPVLLSFCMDFFPAFSTAYRASYLTAFSTVFSAIFRMNYQLLDTVVSYSVNGDYYLPPHLRWLGDALIDILKRPALLTEAPSELLVTLQDLDNAYRSLDVDEMLRRLGRYGGKPPAASVQMYEAYARMLHGDADKAYTAAQSSCATDKHYCSALPYMATHYYAHGDYPAAERFFRGGYSLDPDMNNGLFQFGNCLRKLGKLRESLVWYERDVQRLGAFPTTFLIAETYIKLDERQAAIQALQVAIESLQQNYYARVDNVETAQAIDTAIRFCDRNGLKGMGDALKRNPKVASMYRGYPLK